MSNYTDNDPKGFCGDPKRGAALGRPAIHFTFSDGTPEFESLSVIRKQLDEGGYDENGTYFGIGDPLFWVSSENGEVDYMIRSRDLNDARSQVRGRYPSVAIVGDVYDISLDDHTLQQLLNDELDSAAGPDVIAVVNDKIRIAARVFEVAVLRVLKDWVCDNLGLIDIDGNNFEPDKDGFVDYSIVLEMSHLRGGAGYLYYMEHGECGVGTWDGEWDCLFKDPKNTIPALSEVIKQKTRDEYLHLYNALLDCAFTGT